MAPRLGRGGRMGPSGRATSLLDTYPESYITRYISIRGKQHQTLYTSSVKRLGVEGGTRRERVAERQWGRRRATRRGYISKYISIRR